MIKSIDDLAHVAEDGTKILPSGPCSAWPRSRNMATAETKTIYRSVTTGQPIEHATKVKATAAQMAVGIAKTAAGAVLHGRTSQIERDTRYEKCRHCPELIQNSGRCAQCGCLMPAKTWIKNAKCPLGKW